MPKTSVLRLISALIRSKGFVDALRAMRFAERHVCEDLVARAFHHRCKLWPFPAQLIDDDRPLLECTFRIVLREDGVDERENNLPLAFAGERQRIAHEVNATALPRRFEYFRDSPL